MSRIPLRALSGLPLAILAAAVLALVFLRGTPAPPAPPFDMGAALLAEGRAGDAVTWYTALAREGEAAPLRALAAAADIAGDREARATALSNLVRGGFATLEEHVEAARLLAAAGALQQALTMLYNAERRFNGALDERFLAFYAALALDVARKDIALPLARRMWTRTSSEVVLKILVSLSGA